MKRTCTIFSMAILFMCVIVATVVKGQYPGSDQVRLDPTSIPQFVDFLPHFAGLRVNAQAGGDLIVRAVPTQQVALSTGTVLDNGVVGTTPGAGFGNYFVYSISKDGGNSWTLPLWPSFTIEARRGNSLNVTVRNNLYGVTYQDVNIPADQTIMMSGVPLTGDPMTEPYTGPVPIALHLHGGEVPSTSDGGPDAWFTPGYAMKGRGFENGVDSVLFYPNTQEAATLWYHEHSQLGLTRVNVYAGMAGFYFLRGFDEEFDRLPGWSKDDLVKEVTPAGKVADALHPAAYLPEIEIVIQDRMFDTKGQLFYEVEPTNPSIHPFWTPEFFGDVITVNGKSWPYLSVAPRKYRFHMLNGSNARFYNLWIQNLTTGVLGPVIRQVGTDGGLMDNPARIDPNAGQTLLLGNGERADIVIDFSAYPPGTVLTLMNNAPAPYPDGDPVTIGTTDRIMQFVVNGKMVDNKNPKKVGIDKSLVPNKLRIIPMVKLTDWQGNMNVVPDKTRQLTLNEVATEDGPTMVLLNNSRFEDMPEMGMFGAPTETPVEGTTEEWQLINMTMDAHPMHMHLVQFQLVSRQSFDVDSYRADYMNSFSGVNGGMEGMYMGAEGPPFLYNVPNSDGAVGGNLPVTPYLQGTPAPPDPNERGWKDVIKIFPGQVMTYVVRFAPTDLPVWWPKFFARYSFDPSEGPGYVWHCHIVEHEDNDMMRPLLVQANPSRNYYKETPPIADNTVLPGSENPKANADFVLAQNYPNPFNDQTVINFRIPEEMHVQLKLYNQMGVEVKTLIDGVAPSGNQTVYMYCDDLPGGIYYYQLLAGEFNCTKKMVVAR